MTGPKLVKTGVMIQRNNFVEILSEYSNPSLLFRGFSVPYYGPVDDSGPKPSITRVSISSSDGAILHPFVLIVVRARDTLHLR